MPKITPTVGRVVWFHPSPTDDLSIFPQARDGRPMAAIIANVWSDSCVNLTVLDPNGVTYARHSVLLIQEGEDQPASGFAEWMPFQKGQAAKTETLEKALGDTRLPMLGRFDYCAFDEQATALQAAFKAAFVHLADLAEAELVAPRYKALLLTKLEEAYMCVGKAVRDDQWKRTQSAPLQESRSNG